MLICPNFSTDLQKRLKRGSQKITNYNLFSFERYCTRWCVTRRYSSFYPFVVHLLTLFTCLYDFTIQLPLFSLLLIPHQLESETKRFHAAAKNLLLALAKRGDITNTKVKEIESRTRYTVTNDAAISLLELVGRHSMFDDAGLLLLLGAVWRSLYRHTQCLYKHQSILCQQLARFPGAHKRVKERSYHWDCMLACETNLVFMRDRLRVLLRHCPSLLPKAECLCQTTVMEHRSEAGRAIKEPNGIADCFLPSISHPYEEGFLAVKDILLARVKVRIEAVMDALSKNENIVEADLEEANVYLKRGKYLAALLTLDILCDGLHLFALNTDIVKLLHKSWDWLYWFHLCRLDLRDSDNFVNTPPDLRDEYESRLRYCIRQRERVLQWMSYHRLQGSEPCHYEKESF